MINRNLPRRIYHGLRRRANDRLKVPYERLRLALSEDFQEYERRRKQLVNNQRSIKEGDEQKLREAIHRLWFDSHPLREMFDEAERASCMHALLFHRLENTRARYIPWLDSVSRLAGAKMLEVGCGSGPASIAFLEQGASVVGADVNEDHIELGRVRLGLYGFEKPQFINILNKEFDALGAGTFDWVIFMASLEHMYLEERLNLLRRADQLLEPGGYLAVVECPNRLWYEDTHTSWLPFFNWIRDETAFRYGAYSNRSFVRGLASSGDAISYDLFIREGRGASFHDLQLALGKNFGGYEVVSSLVGFEEASNPLSRSKRKKEDVWYSEFIASKAPHIHKGFFEDSHLNIILRKPFSA
jgi:2-polyprenyl-3-methyl-5-hydroxy-6-metoxy-1,4-benzoquinol methylase